MTLLAKWVYPVALLALLSIWFLALRAPLWLDETLSYWQVSGGFRKVWSRSELMPSSIGYLYTLWFAKSIFGSAEIALKIPSLLALLVAVYFLFQAVREFFDVETAFLTSILFCLESNIVFAATDARPYAFALLATNLAIFAFVRWMERPEVRRAVWFGASAALILYFHYLFASILPAFAVYYLVARGRSLRADARQLVALFATFTLLIVPLILRVALLYHNRVSHVVPGPRHPVLSALNTLAPVQLLIGFVIVAFLAALAKKIRLPERENWPALLLGPLLTLVPAGILFGVTAATEMHLIIPRYFSVVAPGSALLWAWLTTRIDSRALRLTFCVGLVAVTAFQAYGSPLSRKHELSFKPAHEFVNANLGAQPAPVLECSAFIESNYEPLPSDLTSENALISQVDYYRIHAPVILLPMTLNDETVRIASQAVGQAAQRHQRFLVVGAPDSYRTLEWLADYSQNAFTARVMGKFDDIVVAEFEPI